MQGEANQNKAGGMFSMWSELTAHYFNSGVREENLWNGMVEYMEAPIQVDTRLVGSGKT